METRTVEEIINQMSEEQREFLKDINEKCAKYAASLPDCFNFRLPEEFDTLTDDLVQRHLDIIMEHLRLGGTDKIEISITMTQDRFAINHTYGPDNEHGGAKVISGTRILKYV